ncbi:MAG TPA: hypothetical protein VKN99_03550, partial [Polyangia bacterium]|nr:hypothetical protein [Polyangia bacterium]
MRARALLSPLAVLLTLLCYGCATTLPPAAVAMDDQFAAGQVHATQLLLLPTEVQIALFNEAGPAPQSLELEVSRAASAILENATRRALEGQGYPVAGVLTWDGAAQLRDGRRVQALDAEGMALLYGAVAQGQAPPPEVLAAAQSATGADAVLFLAASGQDIPGESTGEKVAKGIFIGLFIAVIAIALIASHHSGGSRAAGIGRGAGSAVAGAARVGASVHVAMPSGVVAGA